MEKSISTESPEQFRRDPDGSTVFRWDIKQVQSDEGIQYEASEARIYTTPTKENVEVGAIEAFRSLSEQAGLLHDNNESLISKGKPTAAYFDFLTERTKIKAAVALYFDSVREKPVDDSVIKVG